MIHGAVDAGLGKRRAVADGDEQRVHTPQDRLQSGQLVPECVGRIQRLERTALAQAVPFGGEGPDMDIENVPDEVVQQPALRVLVEDGPGLLEQLIDARERRDLLAIHIGQGLGRDARNQLNMQAARRSPVFVSRVRRSCGARGQGRIGEEMGPASIVRLQELAPARHRNPFHASRHPRAVAQRSKFDRKHN